MNTSAAGTVSISPADVTLTNPQWSNGNKTVTYSISGLAYATAYTFAVSGFTDVAGNAMTAVTSGHSFTTVWDKETAPTAGIDYANENKTEWTFPKRSLYGKRHGVHG